MASTFSPRSSETRHPVPFGDDGHDDAQVGYRDDIDDPSCADFGARISCERDPDTDGAAERYGVVTLRAGVAGDRQGHETELRSRAGRGRPPLRMDGMKTYASVAAFRAALSNRLGNRARAADLPIGRVRTGWHHRNLGSGDLGVAIADARALDAVRSSADIHARSPLPIRDPSSTARSNVCADPPTSRSLGARFDCCFSASNCSLSELKY